MIADAAAATGFGVLHYDAGYDTLAEVLPFESHWIVPRGSLDQQHRPWRAVPPVAPV